MNNAPWSIENVNKTGGVDTDSDAENKDDTNNNSKDDIDTNDNNSIDNKDGVDNKNNMDLSQLEQLNQLEANDMLQSEAQLLSKKDQRAPIVHIAENILQEKIKEKEHVLYVLDDDLKYVFPNNGYFASLIDFSRAIINPKTYEQLADPSIPSIYKLVADEEKFRTDEINTLINLYIQVFPSKLKQKEELIVLFKNHFDVVFKVLSMLDLYMFFVRLSRIFHKLTVPVSDKCVNLVDKIFKLSESYLTQEMNNLIESPNTYAKKIETSEWPVLNIIKKCFIDFSFGDKDILDMKGTVTDMYCYENDLRYNLSTYQQFPEILRCQRYFDKDGSIVTNDYITKNRSDLQAEHEKQKLINLEMMNYIAMRHKQKLF